MNYPKADLIIENAIEVVTCTTVGKDPLGRIRGASVAVAGGIILAVGPQRELEKKFDLTDAKIINAEGKVIAPGFVDCHTHTVFGKSRVKEFALKMTHPVSEIEAAGIKTGIPASILMTRDASEDDLFTDAQARLQKMLQYGTTTVESKSGYGIDWPAELKMLKVNKRLAAALPMEVVSTFLGAHDFPPEIDRDNLKKRNLYIHELTEEMIPRVAEEKLAEFCDIYCDTGYYTAAESETVLRAGMKNGLLPRIHTDAYANIGGSTVAAELPAVTADHLNYTTEREVERMAERGVVGVVLPALDFAVAHPDPCNARALLDSGMTLALGTNLNPGSWTESMQIVMQFACRNHRMSPEEAMLAATTGAARALKRENRIGKLAEGFQADIQIWDIPSFEDIIYRIGNNAVCIVLKKGEIVVRRNER
jgi:imidazolonepropionase